MAVQHANSCITGAYPISPRGTIPRSRFISRSNTPFSPRSDRRSSPQCGLRGAKILAATDRKRSREVANVVWRNSVTLVSGSRLNNISQQFRLVCQHRQLEMIAIHVEATRLDVFSSPASLFASHAQSFSPPPR